MNDFQSFSKLVTANYLAMAANPLFTVSNVGIFAAYLAAFPEGSNPLYKERTEHDCQCCAHFIRNLGRVVSIKDGVLTTIWDVEGAQYPYDIVAKAMSDYVRKQIIDGAFFSEEKSYGHEFTMQQLEDGSAKRWNHFNGPVLPLNQSAEPDKQRGIFKGFRDVLHRGLNTLSLSAIDTVLELIGDDNLYRGADHKNALVSFRALMVASEGKDKELFAWENGNNRAAGFRNTVIGTLVTDLSEGKPTEIAVAIFEDRVSGTKYKRPKPVVTAAQVQAAMKTLNDAGLEPATKRRYAKISDVSVNNVLWVNNDTKVKMKGGIEGLLMATIKPILFKGDVTAISIDDFMGNILPNLTALELMVANSHLANFVSLTAPVLPEAPPLFKWDNGFAWSYDGNVADSDIRAAVQAKGGRVDGAFRFSHSWNHGKRNASLMDLHVFMPGCIHSDKKVHATYGITNNRVGWNNRSHAASGGSQDVDYTAAAPEGCVPVENITFPSVHKMPDGVYECKIHNWSARSPNIGGFKAEIEFAGQVFEYDYDTALENHEWVHVASVRLHEGVFTIKHHIPCGAISKEKWGVQTETFVPVNTLMYSPNYWDDNRTGNKHYIFMLEGCKNPGSTRGIYNEYLRSELEGHGRVMEVLGSQTHCPPSDEQLSGLGFSSTRKDSVVVRATTGSKVQAFKINF